MAKAPLIFTHYITAPVEKVWDGFVSKEANRTIFMGAEFEADLKSGGASEHCSSCASILRIRSDVTESLIS
jgi:uncharacterized protein YndB with AHSA1/START domain